MTRKEFLGNITSAKNVLKGYSKEELNLLRSCKDDMNSIISDSLINETTDEAVGNSLTDCLRDYASEAAEEFDMTSRKI